jgi:hypothetical protein
MRVDVTEWVGLAADRGRLLDDGRDFYSGPEWIAYQAADPCTRTYVVRVRDEDGVTCASTPVFVVADDTNRRYDPSPLGASADDRGRRVLVGGRRGHGSALVVAASRRDVGDVVTGLLDGVRSVVASEGCHEAWLLFVPDATARLLAGHAGVSGPFLSAGDASIVLAEPGWDAYLDVLDKKGRSRVTADRRRWDRSGAVTSEGALSSFTVPVADLLVEHQAVHGLVHERDALRRLLEGQAAVCDAVSHVFLAREPGEPGQPAEPGAATLTYRDQRRVTSRAFGGREPWSRAAAAYFELTYYRPIELAARWGLSEVHLGIGTTRTKTRRGATVEGRWGLSLDARGAVDPLTHNRSAWAGLRDETGGAEAWAPATRDLVQELIGGGA